MWTEPYTENGTRLYFTKFQSVTKRKLVVFQSEPDTDESYVSQLFIMTHKDSLQLKPRLGTQPKLQVHALATFIGAPEVCIISTHTLKKYLVDNIPLLEALIHLFWKTHWFTCFVKQCDKMFSSMNFVEEILFEWGIYVLFRTSD